MKWIMALCALFVASCTASPQENGQEVRQSVTQGNEHMTGPMMVRIAEIEIYEGQMDAYQAILKEEQAASVRLEPGVIMLHSVVIADEPNQVRLLEVYANQTAYEAHIASPHFVIYKTSTEKMVKSLRLVPTNPILLCSKALGGLGNEGTCIDPVAKAADTKAG